MGGQGVAELAVNVSAALTLVRLRKEDDTNAGAMT